MSAPSPAPSSRTRACPISASGTHASAIPRTIRSATRKFCPKLFLGKRLASRRRARASIIAAAGRACRCRASGTRSAAPSGRRGLDGRESGRGGGGRRGNERAAPEHLRADAELAERPLPSLPRDDRARAHRAGDHLGDRLRLRARVRRGLAPTLSSNGGSVHRTSACRALRRFTARPIGVPFDGTGAQT